MIHILVKSDGRIVMDEYKIACVDNQMLKQVDIRTVESESLVDLNSITVNDELPREKKIAEYISKVKNPYCFKVGKIVVGVEYSDDGGSFEQRMESYLKTL